MYIIPKMLYKCPRCAYEFEWSPSPYYFGISKSDLHQPYCENCYIQFLNANVPRAIRMDKNDE